VRTSLLDLLHETVVESRKEGEPADLNSLEELIQFTDNAHERADCCTIWEQYQSFVAKEQ
jgi:hypothetical protein